MKIVKTVHQTLIPISNEEGKVLEKLDLVFDDALYHNELSLREQSLASTLHSKGVLDKKIEDDELIYFKF